MAKLKRILLWLIVVLASATGGFFLRDSLGEKTEKIEQPEIPDIQVPDPDEEE